MLEAKRHKNISQNNMTSDDENWSISIEEKLKAAAIVQVVSATVSVLASVTLIVIICRSHKKLSTTLHRLLLGLSISDAVASLAMSFASIPSPPGQIGWNRSGNMSLCRAQGFMIFTGLNASPLYNCSLCLYYLIEIKFTHLTEHMNRIEVYLHLIPISLPLVLSSYILANDEFQPNSSGCFPGALQPFECRFNPAVECEEPIKEHMIITLSWSFIVFILVPLIISVSMIVIYREVAFQERSNRNFRYSFSSRGSTVAHRNTTAARNRATAYSLAWLLAWSVPFIIVFKRVILRDEDGFPFALSLARTALHPLQGLFNFMVYIHPKMTHHSSRYKRDGVAHPKRFLLSLRDALTSRGRPEPTQRRMSSSRLPSWRRRASNQERISRQQLATTQERREDPPLEPPQNSPLTKQDEIEKEHDFNEPNRAPPTTKPKAPSKQGRIF